jgi:hypothetical protein
MAVPYSAGKFRRDNPALYNSSFGIFPDKMARESLKSSGAGPAESLELMHIITQDGKTPLFSEIC